MLTARWFINSVLHPDTNKPPSFRSGSGTLPDGAQTWHCHVSGSWVAGKVTAELLDADATLQLQQEALIRQFVSRCGSADQGTARLQLARHGWEINAAVRSYEAEVEEQRKLKEQLERVAEARKKGEDQEREAAVRNKLAAERLERERKETEAGRKMEAETRAKVAREKAEVERRQAQEMEERRIVEVKATAQQQAACRSHLRLSDGRGQRRVLPER